MSIALVALATAAVPVALAAMPPAQAWEIGPWVRGRNYSEGMPTQPAPGPGGSLVFDFPTAGRGQIDALTASIGSLAGARQITLRYRIDAAPGTRFVPDEMPNEPATVSVYFQQRGDSWSGNGPYESYRWYSPARTVIPLAPGEQTVTMRLDETWINVNGKTNSSRADGFATALADTARIGLAFGSPSLRSHGVYATGPARFTLLGLDVS